MTLQARRDNHLVLEATVADCSLATETISIMSSSVVPTTIPKNSESTSTPTVTTAYIGQVYNSTFGMPSGIKLSQFDGSNWSNWSGMLKVLLTLHEAEDIFTIKLAPPQVDKED